MQAGFRSATVRLLAGLAVVAFFGAGALLAIGPNRTSDWTASDCGAPIRWLTDDHPYDNGVIVPFSHGPGPFSAVTAGAHCSALVWQQIHWSASLGVTGLGLVATARVVARTRRRRVAARLIAL